MRAIYVNLDRSGDRREWMESQAAQLGITLERLSAVDGARIKDVPTGVPAGAMGCFLSHRAIWAGIASGADEFVLVLEDDAHLSRDLPRFIREPGWIPQDADLVHLGRSQKYCKVQGHSRAALDRVLWRVVSENTGTAAYIISKSCAQRLSNDFTTIDREFDQILFNGGRPDLTIYKLLPSLCMQDKLTAQPRFDVLIDRPAPVKPPATMAQKARREMGRVARQV
jgi:glycosyl transferase family 25